MHKHHTVKQITALTIIVTLLASTLNPMVVANAYTVDDVVSVKTVDKDIMLSTTPNSPYSMSDISSQLDFATALSGNSFNVTTRDIDATDLSNWYVYDHYDIAAYKDEDAWEAATGYNKNLRPYFAYNENSWNQEPDKKAVSMDAIADESNSYVWGNTYALNEHITASSKDGKAAMNFYGYGVNPFVDFLFYPADSTGSKKVQYTIDAKDVRTHSLNSAGFLFNCATVNDTLTGYVMLFEYGVSSSNTGSSQSVVADSIKTVSLYYLDDMSIDDLHNSSNQTLTSMLKGITPIAQTDLSGLVFADHFDVSDISLEITSNSLKAYMTEAGEEAGEDDATPKTKTLFDIQSYDASADTYCASFVDTGYGGFGPIVAYQSHGCKYTSSYKYSNLRMSITSTSSVLDGVSDTDFTQNKDDGTTLSESDKYFVLIGDNTEGDEGYTDYFKRQSDAVFLEKLKQEHVILITNLNIKQVTGDINGTDYNLEEYLGVGNVIQLTSDNLDDMMQEVTSIIQKNSYFADTAQLTKDAIEETDSEQSAASCIVTYNGFQVDTINRSRIPKAGVTLTVENPVVFNATEPTYSISKPDGTIVDLDSNTFVVTQSGWDSGVYTVTTSFKEGIKATTTFTIASCYNCYFNGELERAGVDNDGLSLLTGTVGVNAAAVNGEYQTQLIPDTGYTLPSVVKVYADVNGDGVVNASEQLSPVDDYTYDATSGELVVSEVKGNLYIYADTGTVTYDIFPLQTNGAATCGLYEDYTATLASEDAGYPLPEWVTLKLGEKQYVIHRSDDAVSVGDGTIQYKDGVLTITSGVLADNLTVTAIAGRYKIANELTHVETDNQSTAGMYGEDYTATLKASAGYSLPSSITVLVGENEMTDEDYTYNRTTGAVAIRKESITDDITIRAEGVLNTYPVSTRLTHLSCSGDAVANADAAYQAQLTPDTGYSLPETIQVQVGDTILDNAYKYDFNTGKLVIDQSAISGDINITADAVANTYVVSYRLSNLETNGASTVTFGTYYGAGLSAADGYLLPSAITVQVADKTLEPDKDYTYTADTGVFLIRPEAVTDSIVISAAGQEKEKQAEPDVSTFQIIKPEYENTKEGKIIGVTAEMEYSLDDGGTWIPCTSDTIANLGVGTVQIRFRETDTKTKSPVATVNIESITSEYYIPTITVSKKMGVKQKFQIKLKNIKGAAVKCTSTNPKVATVTTKGVITAKKVGKTKVVITIIKGKHIVQYVANVKVSKKVPRNYSLVRFQTDYKSPSIAFYKKINKGKTWRIKLTHTKNTQLLFESSNKNVAIVDEKGRVRGDNPGKATITITVQNKEVTDKYYAVVRVVDENSTQDVSWLKVLK